MRFPFRALPRLRPLSVRTRLTLWSVAVVTLALVVSGVALRAIVQASLTAPIDRSLKRLAQFHAERTAHPAPPRRDGRQGPGGRDGPGGHGGPDGHGGPGGPDGHREPMEQSGALPPSLLDLHAHPLRPISQDRPWDPATFPLSARGQEVFSTIATKAERRRVFSIPLRSDGRIIGVVQVAASLAEPDTEMAHLTRALLTLIPLVLLIAGAGGAFLTGRTLRPVRDITRAANRIGVEDLAGRLAVTGQDEFSELAATFNGMLGRLESAFHKITVAYEQERRFTADASHELRTPLTIMKANTSLALSEEMTVAEYREAMTDIDGALDRTIHLVQSLLLLARADAGQLFLSQAPVALRELARKAARSGVALSGRNITVEVPETLPPVVGDADALLQVLTNLLENAARHTPPEGQITVTGAVDGDHVVLKVWDTGEGIAPEHLPHIFERFYRVESSRSQGRGGTGLGLAICRDIVQAHGGAVSIDSTLGQGTTVCLRLPR